MSEQFDISVIIVSWNAKSYLEGCLRSIRQNLGQLRAQVIVVDNDSSDGSARMVEEQFPEVDLVRAGANLGFAKANNIGISRSTSPYLFLVNSDIVVLGDALPRLVEFMKQHPKVGLSGPRVLNADGSLQVSCRHFPGLWNSLCFCFGLSRMFPESELFSEWFMRYWGHDQVRNVDVLSGCFWVARSGAVKDVGTLDESFFFYGEDIDWCRRFNDKGWKVTLVPGAQVVHFGGASSANAPLRFHIEMQRANLQYWRKHRRAPSVWCYRAILFLQHLTRLCLRSMAYPLFRSRRHELKNHLSKHAATLRWLVGNPRGVKVDPQMESV